MISLVAHWFRTSSPLFYYRDSVFASTGIDVSEHFVRLHPMPHVPVYFCRISFFFMVFTSIFSVGVFVVLLQPFSEFDSGTYHELFTSYIGFLCLSRWRHHLYLTWRIRADTWWTAGVLVYNGRFSMENTNDNNINKDQRLHFIIFEQIEIRIATRTISEHYGTHTRFTSS